MASSGQIKNVEFDAEHEARRRTALAQLRHYPDPALRMRAREVEVFDEALARQAERMIELMHDAAGVGLAANQVGILQRMFTIELGDEEPAQAIVNPRITPLGDELETEEEGCLSLQGVLVPVERSVAVRLEAQSIDGERAGAGARRAAGAGGSARGRPSRRDPDLRSHHPRGAPRGARLLRPRVVLTPSR